MSDPGRLADQLSGLLHSLYAAAAEASLWPQFMRRLADALNSGPIALHRLDPSRSGVFEHALRWDPDLLAGYGSHWSKVNPWLPPQRACPPEVGDIILSSNMYPDSRLSRTDFYDGFLAPQDVFYCIGLVFQKRPPGSIRVTTARAKSRGPYDALEQQLLRLLGPHLDRALTIQQKMGHFDERSRALGEVVARLPIAVFLLDARGAVFFANERAEGLLRQRDGLALDADRSLVATRSKETARLRQLVHQAAQTSTSNGREAAGNMLLPRPGPRKALHACVLPLKSHHYYVGVQAAAVAVLITESEGGPELSPEVARSLYDLTPAESRLASKLLGGLTLKAAAAQLDLSLHTVRAQLKSVFSKTGTNRQAELVRVLALGPGLTAGANPAGGGATQSRTG
jgi:DNA-binding CsgD family transcriptional regulator